MSASKRLTSILCLMIIKNPSRLYSRLLKLQKSIILLPHVWKLWKISDIGNASIRNYDRAKNYYYRSLSLGRKHKLLNSNSFIYQRLFKVHILTDSDSAFYYMEKIMKGARELNDPNELAFSYNNYYSYYIMNKKTYSG
jgi:hypothetical protein